jgi:dynein heavy chain 1
LGGLLFPEAFLTATRQYVSQHNSWSLEELELKIQLHDNNMVDENSFLIKGMYIEGATWSSSTRQLGITNEISS